MKYAPIVTLALAVALTSCSGGGGGGDFAPAEPTPARGAYDLTFNTGGSGGLVILSDGTYWGVYTSVGNDAVIAGFIQGNGTTNGNTFTSTNGRDFDFEAAEIYNFSVNSTFSEMESINGTATYAGGSGTFAGVYDASFDETPTLAAVVGSYTGEAVSSGGNEFASFSINGAGQITGSGSSGCTFSGSLAPRTDGNVFDVTLTFNGGVCVNGTNAVRGIAVYEPGNQTLLGVVLNNSRTNGALFIGSKP